MRYLPALFFALFSVLASAQAELPSDADRMGLHVRDDLFTASDGRTYKRCWYRFNRSSGGYVEAPMAVVPQNATCPGTITR